jgi:ketosteroid isomerase-like protein
VFAQIPAHYDNFSVDIQDIFANGDKVVVEGFYRGVWKATGKEFKANAAHIWTLKEGKAIKCMQAVDTAEIMNP